MKNFVRLIVPVFLTIFDGTLAYRLTWQDEAGQWSYSRIVTLAGHPGPDAATLRLFPNPAAGQLTLSVISVGTESASITIANALGQSLYTQPIALHTGANTVSVPLQTLAPGAYFLILSSTGRRVVKPFIVH